MGTPSQQGGALFFAGWFHDSLWIQTLSEKVLNFLNHGKLYPKHFLSEGTAGSLGIFGLRNSDDFRMALLFNTYSTMYCICIHTVYIYICIYKYKRMCIYI